MNIKQLIAAGATKITNFLSSNKAVYAGDTSTEADEYLDLAEFFVAPRTFDGQAHGGSNTKTFSATGTFNANDGNNQRMVCTGDTTINIANELPGTYIFDLPISGSGVSSITLGASLGTPYDNTPDLVLTAGSINTITVYVNPNGDKRYTINTITA